MIRLFKLVLPAPMPENVRWLTIDVESALPPKNLIPICKLKQLQSIRVLNGATGLPSCFGGLTELLAIDIRNGFLGDTAKPLPPELGNLTKMVDFVAFEQAHMETEECPTDPSCEPSYQTIVDTQSGAKYVCKSPKAWAEDLSLLPVFGWSRLEKFWVDANRLFASPGYIRSIAKAWPRLRTLDLYDNEISLDAAELEAFAGHTLLHQAQLQKNRMKGTFPASILNGTCPLKLMHMSLNPDMGGCVSPKLPGFTALTYKGTRVRVNEKCPAAEEL